MWHSAARTTLSTWRFETRCVHRAEVGKRALLVRLIALPELHRLQKTLLDVKDGRRRGKLRSCADRGEVPNVFWRGQSRDICGELHSVFSPPPRRVCAVFVWDQ